MGKYNFTALRVRQTALSQFASGKTSKLPQWVDVVGEITALRQELGYTSDYDVVYETTTALADRAAAIAHAQEVADAGITWYLDSDWMAQPDDPFAYQAQRIQAGPPR